MGAASVLVSVLAYGVSIILLRRQAVRDPAVSIAFFQAAIPALFLAAPASLSWTPAPIADVGAFAVVGVLSVAGYFCIIGAYARAEASRVVAVEYTGFIWAALIGIAVFDEWPGASTLIGGALVILACFLVQGGFRLRWPGRRRPRSAGEAP